jgi:hypothetical protein
MRASASRTGVGEAVHHHVDEHVVHVVDERRMVRELTARSRSLHGLVENGTGHMAPMHRVRE